MSKQRLNLDDLKSQVNADTRAIEIEEKEREDLEKSIKEAEASTIDKEAALKDLEAIDKEIEDAEVVSEAKEVKAVDSLKEMDEVTNKMAEEEKIEQDIKEAEKAAEDASMELFSEENLDLDPEEIAARKEEEEERKRVQKAREEGYLKLKESYIETVVKKDKVDLSGFTISTKPVSFSKIFDAKTDNKKLSAWPLYFSGFPVVMKEFGGPDLETIAQETSNNDLIDQIGTFRIIYNHVVDENKGTLEEWLQKITYLDLSDLFFNVYKASFKGANYLSFNCTNTKCNNMWMEAHSMKDMVEYPNDAVKERYEKIVKQDPTTKSVVTKKLIQVDNYAFSLSIPSIYKIIFEQKLLGDRFREQYSNLMNLLLYVDDIYQIDTEDKMLHSIDTRPDPNNKELSAKRKMVTFSKIMLTLSSDSFNTLEHEIGEYTKKFDVDKIKYKLPATKCPKCGKEVEERELEPLSMLFLRHRLGRVLNISKS